MVVTKAQQLREALRKFEARGKGKYISAKVRIVQTDVLEEALLQVYAIHLVEILQQYGLSEERAIAEKELRDDVEHSNLDWTEVINRAAFLGNLAT